MPKRRQDTITRTELARIRDRLQARGLRLRVVGRLQARGRALAAGLQRGDLADAVIAVCRELPKAD